MDGIPVTGVNELVLEVLDLERAVAFYADFVGLPLVERCEHGLVPHEVDSGDRGRALSVDDPDGNVVELWTWDVACHLAPAEQGP